MDNKKTAGQILLGSLMRISAELERFVKVFDKFEDKQWTEDKDSYEFRVEISNVLKDVEEKIKEIDIKNDKLHEIINELKFAIKEQGTIDYSKIQNSIKTEISNIKLQTKLSDDCEHCEKNQTIKDLRKWVKWLAIALAIIILIVIGLLGFDAAGYLSLPGVG